MKKFFESFLVMTALLLCGPAWGDDIIKIIVFGDSLTSGYELSPDEAFSAKLQRKLQENGFTNTEVENMSVPGETSAGGVERLKTLQVAKPDVVILELGANDILRGLNPKMIYGNLAALISNLKNDNVYVILVGMKAPTNMGMRYCGQVDITYQELAATQHVAFYPFALEGIVGKPELNLADGFHPNDKGVDVMVDGLYSIVDAGVRWRAKMHQYQYDMERDKSNQFPGTDTPIR